ncbi:dihydrofolate reductase [Alkalibacter mobilis]|uniref:dihydrofolate reductase n=1 Tax=Alkalibacter mobilis TaxID=2787712 RepID=UPI00189C9758|nr:dihydrofolate reductase [Alkalibacter mobilis]MBF7095938.1 dihydrofolate reductase [Alkalibacter mobilis]
MISFVLAVGKNNEMGVDNKLPWHLPSDLKYFRKLTEGKPMIMGRETFESLPGILPGRLHIVLTRDPDYSVESPQVTIVNSLDELLAMLSPGQDYNVIGGKMIFDLLLSYADRIYLTKIDSTFNADTYFSEPDPKDWEIVEEKEGTLDEENTLVHKFIIMDRKKER